MRRSVREGIVGFSVIAAVVAFAGTMLWLRGERAFSKSWSVTADFQDAGGLAVRSPVTYRGVMVGNVTDIKVTPQAVRVSIEINQDDLQLTLPVQATVSSASLLGGDSQVALNSVGPPLKKDAPMPKSQRCKGQGVLCDGATIQGSESASLASITNSFQELLNQAKTEQLVPKLVGSTEQFDETLRDIELLATQLREDLARAAPTISNLNEATSQAASASRHINEVVSAFNTPTTITDLKQTVSNARSLTATFDEVGGDVEKLTADPQFMAAVRSVTIGLGQFFNELYPASTLDETKP
ncbi:ABC-type transport system/ periplasmic component [Synechococcus sp. SYN20]|uniref:MlaD family protein n=1 Tax=Synechococcus sp. SYN20 TaxID=1050714 RepID=UPI0016484B0C|nr:MlaD family protein [Synechococcus sp. SYN20]QNJ24680.1 ABC-type transport system/ periplasmic component [Synechococcus sp. SYN20]